MKTHNLRIVTESRWWWLILTVGILFIIGGFAYWFFPVTGFAVAAQLFGWLLIVAGIVKICVAGGPDTTRHRGWWLFGGVIELFIGFTLVRSILLSETVLPYVLAVVFIFWGIESIANCSTARRLWWLRLINGILLCFIGYLFIEGGWLSDMWMVSFLASIAFIYWGISLAVTACVLRPVRNAPDRNEP